MRNKKLNCKFLVSLSYLFIIMISSIILFACSQEPYNFKSEAEKHIINTLATNGFSENEISIQLTNETYSEQINLYTCIAYLEIDSFYSKSIDEMILTYNNLQTNTEFEKDGYKFTIVYYSYITSNGDKYSIDISYGGDEIHVSNLSRTIIFNYESPIVTPYEHLTDRQKFMICMYIEDRYEHYDKLEGKYAGEKYTKTIMEETSIKYNLTNEQCYLIWSELYDLRQIYKNSISNSILNAPTNIIYGDTCEPVEIGQSFNLTPIQKEGFIFKGYFTEENGGTQITGNEGNSLVNWNKPYSLIVFPQYLNDTESNPL